MFSWERQKIQWLDSHSLIVVHILLFTENLQNHEQVVQNLRNADSVHIYFNTDFHHIFEEYGVKGIYFSTDHFPINLVIYFTIKVVYRDQ